VHDPGLKAALLRRAAAAEILAELRRVEEGLGRGGKK
jgi:hypothetical protein